MIYNTGDTHGDYTRFNTKRFPQQKQMTKKDYVIIDGDFGYWADTKEQKNWLDWLESKNFTTLWVDGNHENYDMLAQIPVEKWNGGDVQKIRPSVIRLMRGQVFVINGCKIFTFGGARSHDIQDGILERDDPNYRRKRKALNAARACYRINHLSWWKEEMPNEAEMDIGRINLNKHNNTVDYIISHECAAYTKALITKGFYGDDPLSAYLQEIKEQTTFKKWYFGHYHEDRAINAEEILCYEKIVQIW